MAALLMLRCSSGGRLQPVLALLYIRRPAISSLYDCPPSPSGAYGYVSTGTKAPNSPGVNDLWFDANASLWKIWDGTSWNLVPGSGGGGGNAPTVGTIAPLRPVVGDLWVDITNPVVPQVKIFRQGNAWVVLADTDLLPKATQPGELLVSGPGPTFDWNIEKGLIEGVY